MPTGSREKNGAKDQNTKTHELLKILPILPIEAPISFPDPIPSGIMPRPCREEDNGIVGLNLAAENQCRTSVRSSEKDITREELGNGRSGTTKDHDGRRNRGSDTNEGRRKRSS